VRKKKKEGQLYLSRKEEGGRPGVEGIPPSQSRCINEKDNIGGGTSRG